MSVLVKFVVATVALALSAVACAAQQLPRPSGPVILTVTGTIDVRNDADRAIFDRRMLADLGLVRIRTTTPWTDGVVEFEGIPVKTVLKATGARGQTIHAVAINDYAIDLDVREFDEVPAILAMRMNGKDLSVRDKGPLWLVYPRDDYPALRGQANNFKWIWQLKTLTIR